MSCVLKPPLPDTDRRTVRLNGFSTTWEDGATLVSQDAVEEAGRGEG